MKSVRHLFVPALLAVLATSPASARPIPGTAPPGTERRAVTDDFFGTKVTEEYRWLEDFSDPEVQKWNETQNTHSRAFLDALPHRDAIRHRVEELSKDPSPDYSQLKWRPGTLFAMKNQPPKQQPFLVALRSPDKPSAARTLVDPNKINPKGTTAIDDYFPSGDGKLVAVALSENGSEDGDLHIFETANGRALPDVIPHFDYPTAGGSLAWARDGSGFWYTRYPRPGERPEADLHFFQQIYYHKLGTKFEDDTYSIGKEFPRIAEIALTSSGDGRYIMANVSNGDGGEHAFYVMSPPGPWVQVTRFEDKVNDAEMAEDGSLFLLSHEYSPRGKVLRLPLASPMLGKAQLAIPESDAAIEGITTTRYYLYTRDIVGGPEQVRVFNLEGAPKGLVPLKANSGVNEVVALDGDEVILHVSSYLEPPAWYRYDPSSAKVTRTGLFKTSPASFAEYEVRREFATSTGGKQVPLNIIVKKGVALNGRNPTLLTAYGGYGVNMTPGFRPKLKAWLEQGGVYVVANIRGGGEYGEEWHLDGNLTKKQHDYDDFIASAEHLVRRGYTSTPKLVIEGGSNGGLLMGAVMTQRPDLFRAVVSHVGVYDMLRVETTPNGSFNTTEYGTVKDSAQFRALLGYSPYHNVKDGTAYPSTLLLAGMHDGRVEPYMSRKFAARLQAGNTGPNPVLLRTSASSGHGIGSSLDERVGEDVDVYSFMFNQLDVDYKPVAKKLRRR